MAARHVCNKKRKTNRKMSLAIMMDESHNELKRERYVYHAETKPKTKDQRKAQ